MGSYPKPPVPRSSEMISPLHSPFANRTDGLPGTAMAMVAWKVAVQGRGLSFRFFKRYARRSASVSPPPAPPKFLEFGGEKERGYNGWNKARARH